MAAGLGQARPWHGRHRRKCCRDPERGAGATRLPPCPDKHLKCCVLITFDLKAGNNASWGEANCSVYRLMGVSWRAGCTACPEGSQARHSSAAPSSSVRDPAGSEQAPGGRQQGQDEAGSQGRQCSPSPSLPTTTSHLSVPFPWPHHAQPPHWTPGEKNVRQEKHLKQTSSCPACDAVFLCERRRLFKGLGKQKLLHKAFALSTTAPAGCRPQAGARVAWRGALSSRGPARWQAK